MFRALTFASLAIVALAARNREVSERDGGPEPVPAWLAARLASRGAVVSPFGDFRVRGLTLYEVRVSEGGVDSDSLVGVDARRHMIEGAPLFARIARERLSPSELARRAIGTAVVTEWLAPSQVADQSRCRQTMPRDAVARCDAVLRPSVENGELTFCTLGPGAHGYADVLVHVIRLDTGEPLTRDSYATRIARGEVVDASPSHRRAISTCGEWTRCDVVREVWGRDLPENSYRRLDAGPGAALLVDHPPLLLVQRTLSEIGERCA